MSSTDYSAQHAMARNTRAAAWFSDASENLGVGVMVFALTMLVACGTGDSLATPPVTEPTPNVHSAERVAELARIALDAEADVLFVGDSITQDWMGPGLEVWERAYGHRRALNFGVYGDRVPNVLWRIAQGHFDHVRPRLVLLMIGTNDTRHTRFRRSPAEVAEGVEAILAELRLRFPQARFLVLGILPGGEEPDDPIRINTNAANKLIARLDDGDTVHFRDIGPRFTGTDGRVSSTLMPDGLHLSAEAYAIWAEAIEADVARLLGEMSQPR